MISDHELNLYFVESGGFSELEEPVIVTSGKFLTPFFCNAEKLCGAPDIDIALSRFSDSPAGLQRYLQPFEKESTSFRAVTERICALAQDSLGKEEKAAVSGGQRRDWIFSIPAAEKLGIPHIPLFKADRGRIFTEMDLPGMRAVHIVDLITKGSSIYSENPETGAEEGWIPALRRRGARVSRVIAVVSRCQGGEEAMENKGIAVTSLIKVDASFIAGYSANPEKNNAFLSNPRQWTMDYLKKNGIELLLPYIEKTEKKLPRLKAFVREYKGFLKELRVLEKIETEYRNKIAPRIPWRQE